MRIGQRNLKIAQFSGLLPQQVHQKIFHPKQNLECENMKSVRYFYEKRILVRYV